MSFEIEKCAIPSVWCGVGAPPKRDPRKPLKHYHKIGSRYECMKKGYGSGYNNAKRESLPKNSLQQISYVGNVYEKKFKSSNIANLTQLLQKARTFTKTQNKTLLYKVFTRKKGGLDRRAYNSTLIYMYQHGVNVSKLPICSKI